MRDESSWSRSCVLDYLNACTWAIHFYHSACSERRGVRRGRLHGLSCNVSTSCSPDQQPNLLGILVIHRLIQPSSNGGLRYINVLI